MNRKLQAVLELSLAAAFWGFGFIATVWALETLTALEITAIRFLATVIVGLPVLLLKSVREGLRRNMIWAFWPAVMLTATLYFQTLGMKYTTATKSGFITTLYVVFVPLLESFLHRKPVGWKLWSCVLMAIFGTGLIVDIGYSPLNVGDVLTLICALFATVQIYYMSVISPLIRTPFAFNILQSIWSMLFVLPFAMGSKFYENLANAPLWPVKTWIGILSLAFGSTMLAFFLQVRAQARLAPTVSSLLCLLESPFALILAFTLLNENLGASQAFGAALIFFSAVGASVVEVRK